MYPSGIFLQAQFSSQQVPPHPPTLSPEQIAEATYDDAASREIVLAVISFRLEYPPEKWVNVFKSLALLEYLLKRGHEGLAQRSREDLQAQLETLASSFDFFDLAEGRDRGSGVRHKAAVVLQLLRDSQRLADEREASERTRRLGAEDTGKPKHRSRSVNASRRGRPPMWARDAEDAEGSHVDLKGRGGREVPTSSGRETPSSSEDSGDEEGGLEAATGIHPPSGSFLFGERTPNPRGRHPGPARRSSGAFSFLHRPSASNACDMTILSALELKSPKMAAAASYLSRRAVGRGHAVATHPDGTPDAGSTFSAQPPAAPRPTVPAQAPRRTSRAVQSGEENDRLTARLRQALREPHNRSCADCGGAPNLWYSANLGVFLCNNCAGVHRGLGVHVSFVRSVALDRHATSDVLFMCRTGNHVANAHLEARRPPELPRPSTPEDRKLYCLRKYVRREWALIGIAWPPPVLLEEHYAPRSPAPVPDPSPISRSPEVAPLAEMEEREPGGRPRVSALRRQLTEQVKKALTDSLMVGGGDADDDGPSPLGHGGGSEREVPEEILEAVSMMTRELGDAADAPGGSATPSRTAPVPQRSAPAPPLGPRHAYTGSREAVQEPAASEDLLAPEASFATINISHEPLASPPRRLGVAIPAPPSYGGSTRSYFTGPPSVRSDAPGGASGLDMSGLDLPPSSLHLIELSAADLDPDSESEASVYQVGDPEEVAPLLAHASSRSYETPGQGSAVLSPTAASPVPFHYGMPDVLSMLDQISPTPPGTGAGTPGALPYVSTLPLRSPRVSGSASPYQPQPSPFRTSVAGSPRSTNGGGGLAPGPPAEAQPLIDFSTPLTPTALLQPLPPLRATVLLQQPLQQPRSSPHAEGRTVPPARVKLASLGSGPISTPPHPSPMHHQHSLSASPGPWVGGPDPSPWRFTDHGPASPAVGGTGVVSFGPSLGSPFGGGVEKTSSWDAAEGAAGSGSGSGPYVQALVTAPVPVRTSNGSGSAGGLRGAGSGSWQWQ